MPVNVRFFVIKYNHGEAAKSNGLFSLHKSEKTETKRR